MQIAASELRVADVVRIPNDGEREIRRVRTTESGDVAAWFRGDEEQEHPSMIYDPGHRLEIQRPGDLFPEDDGELDEPGIDPAEIKAAQERVAARRKKSHEYKVAAIEADVPQCPADVFAIKPAAYTIEDIQARGKVYAQLVYAYRAVRALELYALGKLPSFPYEAARRLPDFNQERHLLVQPQNTGAAVAWARRHYEQALATAVEQSKASNPQEARRVFDFCVRDVESGDRRRRPEKLEQFREAKKGWTKPPRPAPAPKPTPAAAKPKTKPDTREELIAALVAKGWRHQPPNEKRKIETVTEPTDTFRIVIDRGMVDAESRVNGSFVGSWLRAGFVDSLDRIANHFDASLAQIEEMAEKHVKQRAAADAASVDRQREAAAPVSRGQNPVKVHFSPDQGVLLGGAARTYGDIISKLRSPFRFRRSRNLPAGFTHYVPRSRNLEIPRERIDLLATLLRSKGIPVEVDYMGQVSAAPAEDESTTTTSVDGPTEMDLVGLGARVGLVPGETRQAEFSRVRDAFELAEPRGWSVSLRRWINEHKMADSARTTRALGYVRSRLAFERNEWPPPPLRGEHYSAAEFEGILQALDLDSDVRATRQLADEWRDKLDSITDGRGRAWFSNNQYDSWARRVPYDVQADFTKREGKPTPALARVALDETKQLLAGYREKMQVSLDPRLYDPKSDPATVYRKLCSLGSDIAESVLQGVHGVDFVVRRRDAYALCSGETTLAELGEKARANAERLAADAAENARLLAEDARDVLAVGEDARQRGELDSRRFNLAYWRRFPNLNHIDRESRRLQLTWHDGAGPRNGLAPAGKPTSVQVRGPHKRLLAVTGTYASEAAAIEALLAHARAVPGLEAAGAVAPLETSDELEPDNSEILDRIAKSGPAWAAWDTSQTRGTGWTSIKGKSCFQNDDDPAITLCTTFQKEPVGSCPPSMAGNQGESKKLMLCEPDHEPEFFPGKDRGIASAKQEADNRVARRRGRRKPEAPTLDQLPDALDFAGQQALLDRVVPSRVVRREHDPLRAELIRVGRPLVRTPQGEHLEPTERNRENLPAGSILVPSVYPFGAPLDEFLRELGTEYIPYRGPIGIQTLDELTKLARDVESKQLEGVTLDDFRTGFYGGRSIYWIPDKTGAVLAGPVTATGSVVNNKTVLAQLGEEARTGLAFAELPEGWTLADTISIAALRNGAPLWIAWNVNEERLRLNRGEGWEAATSLSAADFPIAAANSLGQLVDAAPGWTTFRAAGPWLGRLYPSDYGRRMIFDDPTGGTLDTETLEQTLAAAIVEVEERGRTAITGPALDQAKKRLTWAQRWIAAAEKAAARANKPARPRKAIGASKTETTTMTRPKRVKGSKSTPAIAETSGAVEKAANDKPAAKKATSKKAAKKSASKKAAAKKATAKKATAKKSADATPKRPAAKKAAAKKATAKPATSSSPTTDTETKPKAKTKARRKWTREEFRRHDVVRFRKRSAVARGLGVDPERTFKVEMVAREEGRALVVLRVGQGKYSALIKVPPGHLALVERAEQLPKELRLCAARLARFHGPLSDKTRRVLVELARRA